MSRGPIFKCFYLYNSSLLTASLKMRRLLNIHFEFVIQTKVPNIYQHISIETFDYRSSQNRLNAPQHLKYLQDQSWSQTN